MTRIVIVEDERILADMLALWLAKLPNCKLVGSATDGQTGWELCLSLKPDLVMMDIEMPKMDGLEMAQRLLTALPETRLLAMSGLMNPYTIWRVIQSGVHGYFDKTQPPTMLLEAIRAVADGGTYFSPVFRQVKAEKLAQPDAFQKILSDREQEVLKRVVVGQNDEDIAVALGIATATIAVHRKHIRQKLGLHNDRELMAYAKVWGLI